MQYAVGAALTGDRSHQATFRAALKTRAAITHAALSAMPGVTCVAPSAAFYAMPKIALPPGRTDEDYVLALLRATGVLCVYGSGFGLPADDGFLRVVFLAPPDELAEHLPAHGRFHARLPRGLIPMLRWRAAETPRSMNDREFTRRMVRTVLTVAAVGLVLAALAEARDALLLIYVSALIAMGFSPLVRGIERPRGGNARQARAPLAGHPRRSTRRRRRVRPRRPAGPAAARRAGHHALGAAAGAPLRARVVSHPPSPDDAPRVAAGGGAERADRRRQQRGRHRARRDLDRHRRPVRPDHDSHPELLLPDRGRVDLRLRCCGSCPRRGGSTSRRRRARRW